MAKYGDGRLSREVDGEAWRWAAKWKYGELSSEMGG